MHRDVPPRLRTIVESVRFARERDALCEDIELWDKFYAAASWALAHDPALAGRETAVDGVRAIPVEGTGLPSEAIVVFYTHTDDEVMLISVIRGDDGPF